MQARREWDGKRKDDRRDIWIRGMKGFYDTEVLHIGVKTTHGVTINAIVVMGAFQ